MIWKMITGGRKMKLNKIKSLCKAAKRAILYNELGEGGELRRQWIGTGTAIYLLCVGAIFSIVLMKLIRGHGSARTFRNAAVYLLFVAIPFIWFVITKQPIALHYFFQYRTIALSYWATGVFLHYLLSAKRTEMKK